MFRKKTWIDGFIVYSMLMAMHDLKEPYVKWSTEVLRHQQLESVAADLKIHVEVLLSFTTPRLDEGS